MLLRFSYATFLALARVAGSDAFLSPALTHKKLAVLHVGGTDGWDNDDFLEALSGGGANDPADDNKAGGGDVKGDEEVSPGGSKFADMIRNAKSSGPEQSTRAIDNPFLTPPAAQPPATNPGELTIEQQAEMYRTMMEKKEPPQQMPQVQKIAKTNKGGRPVGRNRDADQIANTADLYFAQLKRDSTVRTMARIRGEGDLSEEVFADDGIRALDELLVKNPYLQGQRDEAEALMDEIPGQVLQPYMDGQNVGNDINIGSTGVSYKDMLKQKKRNQGGGSTVATPKVEPPVAQTQPAPIVEEPVASVPAPPVPTPVPEPEVVPPPPAAVPNPIVSPQPAASVAPASTSAPGETKTKIRTLMGFILKHRGGPGFGAGRLKGPEIERFDNLLEEVTSLLRGEAVKSNDVIEVQTSPTFTEPAMTQPPAPQAATDAAQMDSAIACIEGAVTMYKNSPLELRDVMLGTLRAALMSSVKTINGAAAYDEVINNAQSRTAPADPAQLDSAISCIQGVVTMYKNSPLELKEGILGTLQAALLSSVNTINGAVATESQPAAVPSIPSQAPAEPAPSLGPDENSKILEEIYQKIKAASGDGGLGLRSDLTSAEAVELTDQLVEMRSVLMDELDSGIPDPEPVTPASETAPSGGESKYQQMLARARAEKAA